LGGGGVCACGTYFLCLEFELDGLAISRRGDLHRPVAVLTKQRLRHSEDDWQNKRGEKERTGLVGYLLEPLHLRVFTVHEYLTELVRSGEVEGRRREGEGETT